jgi:hypothetical protein
MQNLHSKGNDNSISTVTPHISRDGEISEIPLSSPELNETPAKPKVANSTFKLARPQDVKVKTKREDNQYLWMMEKEADVWQPLFDTFGHLAIVHTIQSPTDENLHSLVGEQENLYVITFRGYYNPSKPSFGVYEKEPLLNGAKNVGGFITTIISKDPEGKEVLAGRSIPESFVKNYEEKALRIQAEGAFVVMFTKPNGLTEKEIPLWGYCMPGLLELESVFEQFADRDYILDNCDTLKEKVDDEEISGEEFTFKQFIEQVMVQHYQHWQFLFQTSTIKDFTTEWGQIEQTGTN